MKRDMNFDGQYTITDLWLQIKQWFFYPGDAMVEDLIDSDIGRFFEFTAADYGGFFSGAFSLFCWIMGPLLIIGALISFREWLEQQDRDFERELSRGPADGDDD